MSDDEGLIDAEETERKKWLMKAPEAIKENAIPKCEECEKLNFLVTELKEQLEAEKRAMDEAIRMVEKLEHDHSDAIKEQKLLLNFEKDKVIMLEKSIEAERKARMEEIYKQDRQTKDFMFVEKDLSRLNEMNQDMVNEFEAVKKENIALAEAAKQLQDNKDAILLELQRYEIQVTELETANTDLRKRLYNSDAERDRFQVLCDKLKAKLERHKTGLEGPSRYSSMKESRHGLAPLRQSKSSLRWPIEQSHQLSQCSTMSMKSHSRISDLSTVNVIKKFNSDPRTIRNSQRKMPGLWPTAI